MDLGDGSAVRLTVSRYYTPTGRSIQRSYSHGNKDYYDEYLERIKRGELMEQDKIEVADSLKFTTPKGKVVYGGGGIIPDVFVPLDVSMENETLNFLVSHGLVSYYVFEELEKDRGLYDYYNRQDFIDNFIVSNELANGFQEYINRRLETKITFIAYYDEIKQYIKALFAEQLFGEGAYREVLNKSDIMIEEVERLSNGED